MMEDAETFVPMKLKGEIVPKYYINKLGQIKGPQGIILRSRRHNHGYRMITIYINKRPVHVLVHRAVAETFIPNPLNLPTVNHIYGKESGDDVWNLEWASYSDNNVHALSHRMRKTAYSDKFLTITLTKESVIEICELMEKGYTDSEIIEMLQLDQIPNVYNKINSIRYRYTWKHVSNMYNIPRKPDGVSRVQTGVMQYINNR